MITTEAMENKRTDAKWLIVEVPVFKPGPIVTLPKQPIVVPKLPILTPRED